MGYFIGLSRQLEKSMSNMMRARKYQKALAFFCKIKHFLGMQMHQNSVIAVVVVVVVVRTYLSDFLLITGSGLDINFPKSALCLFELALMNFPPILLLGVTSSGTVSVLLPES